jgi:hypothetical protein
MGKTAYDADRYSLAVVIVFGIVGNSLVIISILRRKAVLKNNYYYLVLHLAIYDLVSTLVCAAVNLSKRLGSGIRELLLKFYVVFVL